MFISKYFFIGLWCCCIVFVFSLVASDLPVAYRSLLFDDGLSNMSEPWTTMVSTRFLHGNSRKTFDGHEHKTALFNTHGPFKIAHLGVGIEGLDASRPETNKYWGTGGKFITPGLGESDGNVEFGGRFNIMECDIIVAQHLMSGFYLNGYLPIKRIKFDQITAINKGPASVNSVNIQNFLTTTLPLILKENNLSLYTDPYSKSGIGDALLAGGWHGMIEQENEFFSSISGLFQIGTFLPTSQLQSQNDIFSLPIGYNRHFGFQACAAGEIGLLKMFSVGAQASSIIFLKKDRNVRMQTDKNKQQNGYIVLEQGRASVDQGSLWDLGFYCKAKDFFNGCSFLIGYSFSRQERTCMRVKDSRILKSVIADGKKQSMYFSQNDIVNADKRLLGWETHAMHFILKYQSLSSFRPFFNIEYSLPVLGKFSLITPIFSSTVGLSAGLIF